MITTFVSAFAKRLLPGLALILLITLPAACSQGGGRLDGTSNEAFQKWIEELIQQLYQGKAATRKSKKQAFV